MDLLDLWCGCLSWRKLAQHVRWLPKDAALYQSMRLARPPKAAPATSDVLVIDDPLKAMQHGHVEDMILAVLNHLEAHDWANGDSQKRGPFNPTLPPGYKRVGAAPENNEDVAEYLARMRPPTD